MTRRNVARDNALLNHVGQYGLSLRQVVRHCIFDGANPGNAIQTLLKESLLVSRKDLPGSRSYYQLTPAEAARRGFPESKATALSGTTLERRLAVLWFCTMTGRRRHLLSNEDIQETIAGFESTMPHCIESVKGGHLISRLYVVSPQKEPAKIARALKAHIRRDSRNQSLNPWVKSKRYRYVVLADDRSQDQRRIKAIKQAIKRSKISGLTRFKVEFSPSSHSLSLALKQVKDRH